MKRSGQSNVVGLAGRPAADDARLEATNLQCSLSCKRIVFAAILRDRAPGPEGKMIVAAAGSSVEAREHCFSIPAPNSDCRSSSRAEAASISASLSPKSDTTLSASAAISVFLAARLAWTQSAASSADWSWPRLASNRSRNAADCSDPRTAAAAWTGFSGRRAADITGGLSSTAAGGLSRAATRSVSAAFVLAPSLRSGGTSDPDPGSWRL